MAVSYAWIKRQGCYSGYKNVTDDCQRVPNGSRRVMNG
jgi:hypothetical protein